MTPMQIPSMDVEIARRQAECQCDLDVAHEAMVRFIRGDMSGDLYPVLYRCLVAAMRLALVPDDVKADYQVLYGLQETPGHDTTRP